MLAHQNITPGLGAELAPEIQLTSLSDGQISALQQLASQRGIVVARGQVMSLEEQAAFAHRLGEPLTRPSNPSEIPVELIRIMADENSKHAAGEGWHSDVSSESEPPGLSMLRMEVVPSAGGDTLFASMTAAYEGLSPGMQSYLEGLTAVHDFSHGFRESLAEPGGRERLADAVAANPPVRHPVVQTHPETGKKVLFVNALFTTHIDGLPPLESAEVLQFLWRHASLPEFTCRFSWAPDSLVLWDNRSTQHKPVNDFFPATRRLHRVVSEGDQPY